MINYENFGKLKLSEVWPENKDIHKVSNFEFMNDIWVGETYGFTEWLQLEKEPAITRSISIALLDTPDHVIERVLKQIGFDFEKGMTEEQITSILGKPIKIEKFVVDRHSNEYIIGTQDKYYLSLTFQQDKGLTYIVLMNHAKSIHALTK